MIGFIVLLGYLLKGEKWYTTLSGTLKAIIGMLILNVGSGGLVSNFRPILVALKDRFNLTATVIDPYFGQNAVTAGVQEVFGKGFDQVMILLLIAFIVNILLVRFNKITKCRTLFTTGHVQVQQASTAYWLIMFAMPALLTNNTLMLVVMAVVLGAYWAVGSNLTVKPLQELTDDAGFAIAHQQMFGIRLGYILADKWFGTNMTLDWQLVKLEKLGLLPFFSFVVSSEEAGVEKPHPGLFALCAEKAGVSPEECLLVGDSLKGDVLGAENAGMRALWYAPEQSQFQQHPGFSHYSQLKKQIDMV